MPQIIPADSVDMEEVAAALASGGIIIYPTDTAYALGCDASDKSSLDKIYVIKERDKDKNLPLIIGSLGMAKEWFVLEGKAMDLAKRFWPGPLTLVLPVHRNHQPPLPQHRDEAAVRVPANQIARGISLTLARPIISTSANLSGDLTPYSIQEVKNSLGKNFSEVDLVIDSGELKGREVSTIVKICDNEVEIIRQGAIELPNKN